MISRTVFVLLGALSLVAADAAAQNRPWPTENPPRPLAARPINFPPYEIKTLPNGLKVVLVSQHEQPAVSVRMIVRAGAAMDPKDKLGLAMLTASLLDQGAGKRTAAQIADTIDFVGGILSTGAGTDLTYVSAVVMKDSLPLGLQLMADVIRRPTFAPEEVERQRQQAISSLKVAAEDPDSLANQLIDRLIYGFHPYGMPGNGTPESLGTLRREDFVDFHQRYYVPNNALMAIVGDVSAAEAMAGVQQAFGDWQTGEVPAFRPIDPPPATKRIVIVDKPDSVQTEIRVGQIGIQRRHDDYQALDQAVKILGGEGANRLQQVLRSQRGLTYGASADLDTYKVSGAIVAETDTRTSATAETLRVIVDEIMRLQRERVSDGELGGAQNYMVGHFPLTVETPDAIATQVLNTLFYELPLEELPKFRDRVLEITPEDVQRVARGYFKPDRLAVVLVGNANAFINDLKSVGFSDVERVPIDQLDLLSADLKRSGRLSSRPGGIARGGMKQPVVGNAGVAYQQQGAAAPDDKAAADALIRRAIETRGGLEALKQIKTLIAEADTVLTTPDGKLTAKTKSYVAYPNRMRVDAKVQEVDIVQIYADGKAWVRDPGGVHDAPPEMLAEFAASSKRDVLSMLVGAASGTLTVRLVGEEGQDAKTLRVVELSGENAPTARLHIDPKTAEIVKLSYESKMPSPEGLASRATEEEFSDYRAVNGVNIPFKAVVRRGGMVVLERQLTNVELNATIADDIFAKPR